MAAIKEKSTGPHQQELGFDGARPGGNGGRQPLVSQSSLNASPSTENTGDGAPVIPGESTLECAKRTQDMATEVPDVSICSPKTFTSKTLQSMHDHRIGTTHQESPQHRESPMLLRWFEEPVAIGPSVCFQHFTRESPENQHDGKLESEIRMTGEGRDYVGEMDLEMIQEALDLHGDLMEIGAWSDSLP